MRRYLFSTGLFSAILTGFALLRSVREHEPFTWRTGLAWLSWGISVTLAVGEVQKLDEETSTVHLANGERLAYDFPVLATGSRIVPVTIVHSATDSLDSNLVPSASRLKCVDSMNGMFWHPTWRATSAAPI